MEPYASPPKSTLARAPTAHPPIEIRVTGGTGIRAGISEQFGLPYVFGAGFLRKGNTTGPEAGGGNDCANFLVYGARRNGHHIPWCNPAQIRSYLKSIATNLDSEDRTPIPEGAPERGLIVHFHSHVGILWKDLPPLRTLGGEDLIAHHLSGPPEIIPLRKLLKSRPRPTYDILTFPPKKSAITIAIAGDVNFASLAPSSPNPLSRFAKTLSSADLAIANLECAVGSSPPAKGRTFRFTTKPKTLPWLTESGIDLVSLANNHSADAPLTNTLSHLESQKIKTTGAGLDLEAAIRPALF